MSNLDQVIARIAASMARSADEKKRLAERAQAYTGPERRRSRIAEQQRADEQAQQVDQAQEDIT